MISESIIQEAVRLLQQWGSPAGLSCSVPIARVGPTKTAAWTAASQLRPGLDVQAPRPPVPRLSPRSAAIFSW
jgi:hypothetical protein